MRRSVHHSSHRLRLIQSLTYRLPQAEELLLLDQPALLVLVGQTCLDSPAVVLPAVLARLRQVPDSEARGRLLTALLALLPQEDIVTMMERLLEDETLLLDAL